MATIETVYLGNLRTEITHVHSGNKVTTDAPLDNNGKGEYISPTDMLAASLGSCMLTIMGMAARTHGFSIDGTKVSITKVMGTEPRRVTELVVDFYFPGDYSDKVKRIIENAGKTCPAEHSLHPDIKRVVTYHYKQ